MAKSLSPIEAFLAPLSKCAAKHPEIEAEVIWATDAGWQAQDDVEAMMDAEEAPYYAEGMLMEGFQMTFQVLAEDDSPKDPAHIRLFFWQTGIATAPAPEAGLVLVASGTWVV